MDVRLPENPKIQRMQPLKEVISIAAAEAGISDHAMARHMSHFLQSVADRMTRGQAVLIPGFGMFAPVLWDKTDKLRPRCVPRFCAARPFRNQIGQECPVNAKGRATFERYQNRQRKENRPRRAGACGRRPTSSAVSVRRSTSFASACRV